jgi:hypothetical protein
MTNAGTPDPSAGHKRRGWAMVVLGLLLVVVMGFITIVHGPSMLHGDGGFTGTARQGQTFVLLFVLVILFGVNALVGGIRMARTGKGSWVTIGITIGLFLLIAGVTWSVLAT